jgi:hypothetical protein
MVQEAKFPVKYLVRQRCAEGSNSGVKGLKHPVNRVTLNWYFKIRARINEANERRRKDKKC